MTTQLRLLTGGDLPKPAPRSKAPRATKAGRPASLQRAVWLDAQTRQIGRSGIAEARRRLAEINATTERAHDLVKAS